VAKAFRGLGDPDDPAPLVVSLATDDGALGHAQLINFEGSLRRQNRDGDPSARDGAASTRSGDLVLPTRRWRRTSRLATATQLMSWSGLTFYLETGHLGRLWMPSNVSFVCPYS
jgi:hypothetical protein